MKPLVGDFVELEILDEEDKKGNVIAVLERKNTLIRPAVANTDQALVIFAAKEPNPVLPCWTVFDYYGRQKILVICINKGTFPGRGKRENSGYV